jgi:CheY-like chemotaxis protein
MKVVGEADNGAQAIAAAERFEPDVVLMDIRMPELDGIAATQRLVERGPRHTRVLVRTTFDDDRLVYEAMRVGGVASCSRARRRRGSSRPFGRRRRRRAAFPLDHPPARRGLRRPPATGRGSSRGTR